MLLQRCTLRLSGQRRSGLPLSLQPKSTAGQAGADSARASAAPQSPAIQSRGQGERSTHNPLQGGRAGEMDERLAGG